MRFIKIPVPLTCEVNGRTDAWFRTDMIVSIEPYHGFFDVIDRNAFARGEIIRIGVTPIIEGSLLCMSNQSAGRVSFLSPAEIMELLCAP